MTRDLADVIKTCLELDECEVVIHEDYSGRGMFGSKTTGLVGEFTLTDVLSSIIAHAELLVADGESVFCGEELRQDNMGKEYIIY
jgi:hypothetical protein